MKKIQSIPYPTYTTAERDALVGVLLNTKINNSDTGKVEEYNGSTWVESIGSTIVVDAVPTDGSANPVSSNGVFDALATKVDENGVIAGATKTKITYDSKGLVTGGSDATTADISDSTDKRYVTEAEKTVLGNTSGVNSGNQTATTLPVTPPIGFTSTDMQGLSDEFGADIQAIEASTIPPVVSGEKVVTRTPTSVNVDKDIIEMQIAAGTIASANWTTGQATYTGTQGQTTYDSNYKYECIGTNLWIRTALMEARLELYLSPDIDDSGGAKTSAQLDVAYPSAKIGQKVWGTTLYVYEKKATNLWRKTSFTIA